MKTMTARQEKMAARKASAERIAKAQAETRAVVASGKCPICGAGLKRNLSITGWWQCKQLGAEGFRLDATKPSCEWQGVHGVMDDEVVIALAYFTRYGSVGLDDSFKGIRQAAMSWAKRLVRNASNPNAHVCVDGKIVQRNKAGSVVTKNSVSAR